MVNISEQGNLPVSEYLEREKVFLLVVGLCSVQWVMINQPHTKLNSTITKN